MKITSSEEYGLRCLMRLAGHQGEEPLTIPDIASGEGLSLPHVGKIMGILKESGLVESMRGRSGGYVLSMPAEKLTLSVIFRALDDRLLETSYCKKSGRISDQCVHAGDCSILPLWEALIGLMDRFLKDVTLADLEGDDFSIVSGNPNGGKSHVIDGKELEGS